jgi:hypothetical protein
MEMEYSHQLELASGTGIRSGVEAGVIVSCRVVMLLELATH